MKNKIFRDFCLIMITIGIIVSYDFSISDKFIVIGMLFGIVHVLQIMIKITK